MKLDSLVQLHEEVRIIYVVDGYEATLTTGDGRLNVACAKEESILEAIVKLEAVLHLTPNLSISTIRKGVTNKKVLSRQLIHQKRVDMILEIDKLKSCRISAINQHDGQSCDLYEHQLVEARAKLELLTELAEYEEL